MNTVISNLTYLITGSNSDYYSKELKPYIVVFLINLLGLVGIKLVKILMIMF